MYKILASKSDEPSIGQANTMRAASPSTIWSPTRGRTAIALPLGVLEPEAAELDALLPGVLEPGAATELDVADGGDVTVLCGGPDAVAEPCNDVLDSVIAAVEEALRMAPLIVVRTAAEPGKTGMEDASAGRAVARVRLGSWPGRVNTGRVKPAEPQDVITTSTNSCARV